MQNAEAMSADQGCWRIDKKEMATIFGVESMLVSERPAGVPDSQSHPMGLFNPGVAVIARKPWPPAPLLKF